MVNLAVDLTALRSTVSEAERAIADAGFSIREIAPHTDDAALAWIDEEFGGMWSSEAFSGMTIAAYDGERQHAGFVTLDPSGLNFRWLRGFGREPGVGIFGPIGVRRVHRGQAGADGATLGRSLVALALARLRERGYTRAIVPAVNDDRLIAYYARCAAARVVETFDSAAWFASLIPTVVMASGNGSNFQAVLDRVERGDLPLRVTALVCNVEHAFAIERARRSGIPVKLCAWDRASVSRETYDARLQHVVAEDAPTLTLLLGWMHLLSPAFVAAFPQTINIHPAFLPFDQSRESVAFPDGSEGRAFRGAYAVRDAIATGARWIGATAHRLALEADRGAILIRKPLFVGDIPVPDGVERHVLADTVLERLRPIEHETVAAAVRRTIFEC